MQNSHPQKLNPGQSNLKIYLASNHSVAQSAWQWRGNPDKTGSKLDRSQKKYISLPPVTPNFLFRAYTLKFRSQNSNFQLSQLRNVRSLTIRNRSSAIHVHLIEQTVDIQVRNGRVCTLKNVTQLRLINSSITVHIKSLQKDQEHVWPRALSRNSQWKMENNFPQGRITSLVYPKFLLTGNFHSF